MGVIWHFFRSRRNGERSQHGSFTPSTYQGCMENSIQRSNSLFSLMFLGIRFQKASFSLQACCPVSQRAASPQHPHEAASRSHTHAPSALALPRLQLQPGLL